MTLKLGVVMDPIGSIQVRKDSTYAMLLEVQSRGWPIHYMEMNDLTVRDGEPFARFKPLTLFEDDNRWFEYGAGSSIALSKLDIILMRKDPPFNLEYIYCSYILERAEQRGVLVVNRPRALRDANEKMYIAWFPQCTPPTLVSREFSDLRAFLHEHSDIILKPLEGMGGASVFRVTERDPNISVIMETLTRHRSRYVMAQRYIPEIREGDKRILMVDGEPLPYVLARVPAPGESRGNLAAGASSEGRELTERERWIAGEVGPSLKEKGILFAGLDIIGDYLTEINITSPTCIRELDAHFSVNISAHLMDVIESRFNGGKSAE
ncbi:MAG: Glutathione synthetase [Gammaproteobacteria bacterium]|nr:Glutathione synthetase [Gammaproteobacteria bacterium]